MKKIVYSKHSPNERCGIAYFSQSLAKHLSALHVQNIKKFTRCDELYINIDILELLESEVNNLLQFISSGWAKKNILIMHDYRFSHLEDMLIGHSDLVVNLSGESALNQKSRGKILELFTPSTIEKPILGFSNRKNRPLSLSFGFFSHRKKSLKMYISFYKYMLKYYPDWFHIIVASSHIGQDDNDVLSLSRYLKSESICLMNFLPNTILSEFINSSDLGVCFYPTGIMLNNMASMSFFSQAKPVITTYGELTPQYFTKFTLDVNNLRKISFSDLNNLKKVGKRAYKYYWANLSWEVLIKKIYSYLYT